MKKLIVLFIVFLFLSTIFLPEICISKNITKKSNNKIDENKTNYYALIAGCTDYNNSNYTLPFDPFENNDTIDIFYDSLISGENWKKENIITLFNKNATKENITDALLDISEIVKEDDVFLFSWRGHGSEVKDDNSDEKDGTDEVICPYDFDNTTNITDDELNYYFSKIKSKKMILMFESCLSGGLVGGESDIDRDNRLIVLTTFENSLGRASIFFDFPCHFFIAELLNSENNFKVLDKNKDGYLSIQEVMNFAKLGVLGDKAFLFLIYYIIFKIRFRKREMLKLVSTIILFQFLYIIETGHFIFNYLNMIDNVGFEIPLVKLKNNT